MTERVPSSSVPVRASGAQERKRVSDVLAKHWIVELRCNHDLKTDQAFCACATWKGPELLSVGSAVRAWADHVADELATDDSPAVRASGAQETFDQMDVRIKAEMREEEIEEGIRCDCGVRAGVSHFCSAVDHCWIGAPHGNR